MILKDELEGLKMLKIGRSAAKLLSQEIRRRFNDQSKDVGFKRTRSAGHPHSRGEDMIWSFMKVKEWLWVRQPRNNNGG